MNAIYWCVLYVLLAIIMTLLATIANDMRLTQVAITNFTQTYEIYEIE